MDEFMSVERRSIHIFLALLNLCLLLSVFSGGIGFAQDQKEASGKKSVQINATPKTGEAPLKVRFEPVIQNLEWPLKFEWHFGDGTESIEKIPPIHYYESGKYAVTLRVEDKAANVFTASVTIDVDYPCG